MQVTSYALTGVRFKGQNGKHPRDQEGNLEAHWHCGFCFTPPNYECQVHYELAMKIVKRWPDLYEFTDPDTGNVASQAKSLERIIEEQKLTIDKLLAKLGEKGEKKEKGKRGRKVKSEEVVPVDHE